VPALGKRFGRNGTAVVADLAQASRGREEFFDRSAGALSLALQALDGLPRSTHIHRLAKGAFQRPIREFLQIDDVAQAHVLHPRGQPVFRDGIALINNGLKL
jgi:hypothetical protein